VTPEKWDAYLSICRKVETGGSGDDVSRDPRDLAMQREFIATFNTFLPCGMLGGGGFPKVLAPGAITEAIMLVEYGYDVEALVLGDDNKKYLDQWGTEQGGSIIGHPRLNARNHDAHDLDYAPNTFDGYFTVQVHEHWISPYVHIGEVRYCMRDGGIVFVDAAGTTNPDMRQIWHTNLVPEQQVKEQWEYWGFQERWRGSSGDERPQFIFEKLPIGHPDFKNSSYIEYIMKARAAL
jgi:hypothetical protein